MARTLERKEALGVPEETKRGGGMEWEGCQERASCLRSCAKRGNLGKEGVNCADRVLELMRKREGFVIICPPVPSRRIWASCG